MCPDRVLGQFSFQIVIENPDYFLVVAGFQWVVCLEACSSDWPQIFDVIEDNLEPQSSCFFHSSAGITGVHHQASPWARLREPFCYLYKRLTALAERASGILPRNSCFPRLSYAVRGPIRSVKYLAMTAGAQCHPVSAPVSELHGWEPLQASLLTESSRESSPK